MVHQMSGPCRLEENSEVNNTSASYANVLSTISALG